MVIREVLSLDVGERRTGVARANTLVRLPEPLAVIETSHILEAIPSLVKLHEADAIVVGLPRGMEGQETAQTKWVRDWARKLKETTNLPLFWQDEAATTIAAEAYLREHDLHTDQIDAVAACVILHDFLLQKPENYVRIEDHEVPES